MGEVSQKRIRFSKSVRNEVWNKTNCRCGYCGTLLEEDNFCIDHMTPIFYGKISKENLNDLKNLMAACKSCNNFKHVLPIDEFRKEISYQVARAQEYSINFRMAERFSQIKLTPKPIVFYFEKLIQESV